MKQTAILGGTFNPIHMGHLIAGQSVYDTGFFDEICIMPSGNPPHKQTTDVDNEHRLAMCRLAIEGLQGFVVSDLELNREGKIYTVDTFEHLNSVTDEVKYWLIIGADSLFDLHKWHEADLLLATVNFVVVDRGGYDLQSVQDRISELESAHKADFRHVSMPLIQLSSSEIRARVKDGKSIQNRVPDKVAQYITDNQLYK